MFLVSLEAIHEWHALEANRVAVELGDLVSEHDLGTAVIDDQGEIISDMNIEAISDPNVAYELGLLAGQKMALNGLAIFLNGQDKKEE
ncbi:hypothetical protein KDA00_00450 [Candidatus Saccharibacteria bacterium]|nr:hypothetical protein [Candidatus Saccharibacteria bacterium]